MALRIERIVRSVDELGAVREHDGQLVDEVVAPVLLVEMVRCLPPIASLGLLRPLANRPIYEEDDPHEGLAWVCRGDRSPLLRLRLAQTGAYLAAVKQGRRARAHQLLGGGTS